MSHLRRPDIIKTFSHPSTTGELTCIIHSDGSTSAQSYTYTLTGKLASVTDAAGTRSFAYNDYDELVSDSLSAGDIDITHLITETMDTYGRSTGYTYAKGGSVQQTVSYGYGTDGRLNTAGFIHGGETKQFSYKAGDGVSPISRTAGAPGGRGRVRRDRGTLNQYTVVGSFTPEFDADGNQTKVQTSTGIWNVTYNAENRPTEFIRENADGTTTKVTCAYDYMGRRATKKVETLAADGTATTTLHQRYLYRGYLQIACCDLTRDTHPCLWLITWDPTQSTATRPLAIQKDATWYTYGWDLTKNICEVFSADGLIKSAYSYTPYGAVTASGTATQSPRGLGGGLDNSIADAPQGRTADGAAVSQPIQWSSEFYDDELGLVYYNYRHYNSYDGRWQGRDSDNSNREEDNLYNMASNSPDARYDYLGMCWTPVQALFHYMLVHEDIDLDDTRCTDIVTWRIQPKMEEYKEFVLKKVSETQKALKRKPPLTREKIQGSSVEGVYSGVYWIGGFTLHKSYSCNVHSWHYKCRIKFNMHDEFSDPLDLDNSKNTKNPDFWDDCEFGVTFYVNHKWEIAL